MSLYNIIKLGVLMMALAITILVVNNVLPVHPHECEYKLCPFKGQIEFVDDICGCEVGSDCNLLDKIHFDYPNWTYDECEEELFGSVKIKN
jgi:hypothetical protein